MLTGFNTDIEHAGTIYHVQTEDKGHGNPFVESLVYASGEILYSRRTPYHDLVEHDLDPDTVAALMERQHRAIVDAIGSGGLKYLLTRDDEVADDDDTTVSHPDGVVPPSTSEVTLDKVILDYLEAQRGRAHLVLRAASDHDFSYGEAARVSIVAVDSHDGVPQIGVSVTILFKSTAEPRRMVLAEGETNDTGTFSCEFEVPAYNGGTSAVVISANCELGQSEIKHLVHR